MSTWVADRIKVRLPALSGLKKLFKSWKRESQWVFCVLHIASSLLQTCWKSERFQMSWRRQPWELRNLKTDCFVFHSLISKPPNSTLSQSLINNIFFPVSNIFILLYLPKWQLSNLTEQSRWPAQSLKGGIKKCIFSTQIETTEFIVGFWDTS